MCCYVGDNTKPKFLEITVLETGRKELINANEIKTINECEDGRAKITLHLSAYRSLRKEGYIDLYVNTEESYTRVAVMLKTL